MQLFISYFLMYSFPLKCFSLTKLLAHARAHACVCVGERERVFMYVRVWETAFIRFELSWLWMHIYVRSFSGFVSEDGPQVNSEFPSPRPAVIRRLKSTVCPTIYYRQRVIWCVSFPRLLPLCEMLRASSRIWTRAAMSISYNANITLYIILSKLLDWRDNI